jgi:hypothetical protein
MSDLATHIKPLINAAAAALATFEARRAEVMQHEESIARFEKCRDASRQLADAENGKLRTLLKAMASPKDALKHQAARNGHLEDVENFQALADEQRAVKRRSVLELSKAATALFYARLAVTDTAITYLQGVLFDSLPEGYFQLIQLMAEKASSGRDVLFRNDPTVTEPLDFACREVGKQIRDQLKGSRHFHLGSSSLLPDPPPDIASLILSPCQMNALQAEIDAGDSV